MKKQISIILLAALVILSLCACAEKKKETSLEPYSTGWDGVRYTVTPISNDKGTISDGTNTYSYRYEADGSGYSVTFTYPDGEKYTWKENGSSARGETSLDFDSGKYPDGMTLHNVLERSPSAKSEKGSTKNVGLIVFLLVVGVINTVWPQAVWYLDVGWKVKDAEPSEAALTSERVVGVGILIIAAVMIIA